MALVRFSEIHKLKRILEKSKEQIEEARHTAVYERDRNVHNAEKNTEEIFNLLNMMKFSADQVLYLDLEEVRFLQRFTKLL